MTVGNKQRIAVIGSGPMGLTCAYELTKHGHKVDLFEKEKRLGGMSASFDFDGLNIERYYHFLCRTDYPLFELLQELRIEDKLTWINTKMGFFYEGRLYKWGTPQALLAFDGIGLLPKIRYALQVMTTKNIKDWNALDKENAKEWLKKWLGDEAYRVLWEKLFSLKFYEYSDMLSAAWIGTRIKRIALSRDNLFQESLGFLAGGTDVLINTLAAAIEKLGGQIYAGHKVEQITFRQDGSVKAIVVEGVEREYDAVVSTIPIQYLGSLAAGMDADYLNKVKKIDNIAVACIILKLAHPITGNFWLNINDEEIPLPGLIEYSRLNSGLGCSIVYAPYYMPSRNPKYSASDDMLIHEVTTAIRKIKPDFRPEWILASTVSRYEYAQTICPPDFFAMLPPVRTPARGFYAADTCYYYPEDRSISESVRTGKLIAEYVHDDAI